MDIGKILSILSAEVKDYKVPAVDLIQMQTKDQFKVLVTTILSARTKDETTVEVVRKLFSKVRRYTDFNKYSVYEIEKLIYPIGFYKNKARFLKGLPEALSKFNGKVPNTIDDLITLPGVGRKTANLVMAVAFSLPAICVDTHVHHITNRLGYVITKTPFETEMALRKKLPLKHWTTFNSIFVAFGQNTCRPVSPWCSKCPIKKYCKRIGVTLSR